ncbi:MAG: O-antigen ligase family protein [Actinobacteria bacterium]|nr:O-antigen ligase family protein [Actinomycetota bacterium]
MAAIPAGSTWPLVGVARAARDRRVIAWLSVGAGAAVGLAGLLGHALWLLVLGAAAVVALLAVLAPQFLLAIFLVAGGLKKEPGFVHSPVDLTVLTAAGVILAIVTRAVRKEGIPRLPAASALGVTLASFALISVLWSPLPVAGLDKELRFETFTMAAFFAPMILIRRPADLRRLMVFVVVFALFIAFTAVRGKGPQAPLIIAGGTSEIELALYTMTGVVAALYLAIEGRSRWRVLWLVPALVLGNTVIAAGSRGVLIAAMITVPFMGIQAARRARVKAVPIALLLVALVVAIAFGSQLAGAAGPKYAGLFSGGSTSTRLGKRNYYLEDGISMALAHPLGLGASAYQAAYITPYPHNALIEAVDEQGVIGAGLLAALMIAAFRSTLRRRGPRIRAEAILAGGLLIVYTVDAMGSQSFTQFRELWFGMGLALALPRLARAGDTEP